MRTRMLIPGLLLFWSAAAQPACAQSVNLEGIAHIALRVNDVVKSKQFYEKLGFETPFEFGETGKPTQVFVKVNDRQFVELYSRTQEGQSLGLMHVCYESSDLESLLAAYVKRGLNPTEVKKARAGNLLSVLHDADGQVVEYTQYLPGSMHWEDRGKHLGECRISGHLGGATILVKDVAAERAFYVDKLGFDPDRFNSKLADLVVPGSDDQLNVKPEANGTHSEVRFTVEDAKTAVKALRRRGVKARMKKGVIEVIDPDGNLVVLQQRLKYTDAVR